MAIDRSKFKKTSVSQLAQSDKDLNRTMGRKEKTGNGHVIDEGLNLFRAYPAHPDGGEKDSFVVPFVQTFLPAVVDDKDDRGNIKKDAAGNPLKRETVRPTWNAKVHGGKKKDLIEEFINLCWKKTKDDKMDEDTKKKFMMPVYGAYNAKDPKKGMQGIAYPLAWVMYADKYPSGNASAAPAFDELRIKKSVKERMNKLSAIEGGDDPLATDPFSDIEEGRAFKIFKDKEQENPNNIYATELDNTTVTEVIGTRTVKIQKTFPLTDAQLELFLKEKPLTEKYGPKLATRKNFEAQLAGLEILDNKYKMGIFELNEWGEIVLEIDGYYAEVDAVDPENEVLGVEVNTRAAEEIIPEDDTDEFELMNRQELTAYAKEYKTGILVRPALTDDLLRGKLRVWKADQVALPADPLPGEEGYVEQVKESVVNPVAAPAPLTIVGKPIITPEVAAERQAFLDDLNGKKDEVKTAPAAEVVNMSAADKLKALRAKSALRAI